MAAIFRSFPLSLIHHARVQPSIRRFWVALGPRFVSHRLEFLSTLVLFFYRHRCFFCLCPIISVLSNSSSRGRDRSKSIAKQTKINFWHIARMWHFKRHWIINSRIVFGDVCTLRGLARSHASKLKPSVALLHFRMFFLSLSLISLLKVIFPFFSHRVRDVHREQSKKTNVSRNSDRIVLDLWCIERKDEMHIVSVVRKFCVNLINFEMIFISLYAFRHGTQSHRLAITIYF